MAANLFNQKVLKRAIVPAPLPDEHLSVLGMWAEMIQTDRISALKETALRGQFISKIVEGVLGYKGASSGSEYTVSEEQPILRGSVDLALGRFGAGEAKIVAPFELKGAKTENLDAIMPGRHKTPVQQAWEYATRVRDVKWVIVSNMTELRLYGFGQGTQVFEPFDLAKLTEPFEYARFMLLLSAGNLLTGKTDELLKESHREDKDITDALYADYKELREILISSVRHEMPNVDGLAAIATAQTILDRVLFTAFAEDTGLLPRHILEKAFEHSDPFNPRPVWDNFKGLFSSIDKGNKVISVPPYNGGLFAPDPIIDRLTIPDSVCEKFKDIGAYDFNSEVSVTVLGRIFEQSITDVERLKAKVRGEEIEPAKKSGTTGRRKRDGVVYTPDFIARFIVSQTLSVHLGEIFSSIVMEHSQKGANLADYEAIKWRRKTSEREAWETYRDRLKRLRIVDPACGSGVFLVMAFDYMKAELLRVNEKIKELSRKDKHYGDLLNYVPDSEILANNLFGVDVNAESVEIAKLSLWIKTARRGKVLDSLDANLRVGDSLIEDSNFAYLEHGFTWETAFPQVFSEGGFDVVLGNPPYVRMELLKALKPYLETRYEVVSDRADLYCYFYERGLRLLKHGGHLGYISSNTFFKTGSGKPLREYLLREATIESVVDFGDLQVFEGVTTYPAIMTMKRGAMPDGHELRFWKVDALPESNFKAMWEKAAVSYPQAALGVGSWQLENASLRALRHKIRNGKRTLKDIYGSPLYGIKTGLNAAFVIDNTTKEQICADDPRSAELLKPFLEGKDLKRWRPETRGLWLIYVPKNRIDIDDYPAIRDWLLPFRAALEDRATKQEWFELQQAQEAYAPHFAAPKISYPHFNAERNFSFESLGAFSNDKSYLIPSDDKALLALLNSRVHWFIVSSMSPPVRGGFHELRVQYVEKLPIPAWNDNERTDLAEASERATNAARQRLALQTALMRRIPDLCPPGGKSKLTRRLQEWWTLLDFAAFRAEVRKSFKQDIPLAERSEWENWITRDRAEIERLAAEISRAESEIDKIVYGLFDLTADEIALLEASI